MVRLVLGVSRAMELDESDALAAAICHAQTLATPLTAMLAAEGRKRRA
jgi:Holliday junction resolvasome RuvABC endonuclease subunit